MAEFTREDDLLFFKMNGQIMEGMTYKGNNSFEGGLGFNRVKFELLANGDVKTHHNVGPGRRQEIFRVT